MASKGGGIKGYYRQKKSSGSIGKAATKASKAKQGASLGGLSPQPAALVTSSGGSLDLRDDVDEDEEILRQFDLDMSFGPCLGISRMERWERANRLGLNPPKNVERLLKAGNASLDCLLEGRV
ncbi:DNA polymerase delta subunit 4 [Nymphaea thermarum]|nr:DNA polymerase delta subunit 4 [Nymphaea thermarum]